MDEKSRIQLRTDENNKGSSEWSSKSGQSVTSYKSSDEKNNSESDTIIYLSVSDHRRYQKPARKTELGDLLKENVNLNLGVDRIDFVDLKPTFHSQREC